MEFRNSGYATGSARTFEAGRIAVLRTDCGARALARALEEKGVTVLDLPLTSRVAGEIARFQPDTIVTGLCAHSPYRSLNVLREFDESVLERALVLLLVPEVRVEMLSPYFEAGVDDVVSPPHSASAILLRRWIQLRGPGHSQVEASLQRELRLGSLMIDVARRQVAGGERELELSGREFELLLQLYEAQGSVVSRDDLLEDIWGQRGGSEAVLDATVHRLRRKLDRAGAEGRRVATVRGIGYQLELGSSPD